MRSALLGAALAFVAAGIRAEEGEAPQAPPPAEAASEAPKPAAYPFEGEVTATQVRVRAGGNINEREMAVLSKGDRVTVLEEQYGWYRIPCPAGCKAWVNAKFAREVPAAVTAEKREIELTGDNVLLRAADNPKASVLGSFPKGAAFTVVRKKGDWYEVLSPREASAWINAKYVAPLNGAAAPPLTVKPVVADPPGARKPDPKPQPKPDPEDPKEVRSWEGLEADRAEEMKKDLLSMDLDGLIGRYEALGASAKRADLAERCKARAAELAEKKRVRDQIRSGIAQVQEGLQKRLDEINARYEARIRQIIEERGHPKKAADFLETGWLFGVGRMIGCPATHRLNKGNKHLCFLRSEKNEQGVPSVDLGRYYNQYVGVNGERVFDPAWGDVIVVREIQILGEPERAP